MFGAFDSFISEQIYFRIGPADTRVGSTHKICTLSKSFANYRGSVELPFKCVQRVD